MELLKEIFTWNTLVCMLITTLVVKVIHVVQGDDVKFRPRWIVLVVAIVVTGVNTVFNGESFQDWQKLLNQLFVTISTSVLFNVYLGEYTIDRLVSFGKKFIDKKITKEEENIP